MVCTNTNTNTITTTITITITNTVNKQCNEEQCYVESNIYSFDFQFW